jgi:hypothetical protein
MLLRACASNGRESGYRQAALRDRATRQKNEDTTVAPPHIAVVLSPSIPVRSCRTCPSPLMAWDELVWMADEAAAAAAPVGSTMEHYPACTFPHDGPHQRVARDSQASQGQRQILRHHECEDRCGVFPARRLGTSFRRPSSRCSNLI